MSRRTPSAVSTALLSEAQILNEFDDMAHTLRQVDEDWERRDAALQRLGVFARELSETSQLELLDQGMLRLRNSLLEQLRDLRSAIIKSLCAAVSAAAAAMRGAFEPHAEQLFPHLLKLTYVTKIAISEPANTTLRDIAAHTRSIKLLSIVTDAFHTNAKNNVVRHRCVEYTQTLVHSLHTSGLLSDRARAKQVEQQVELLLRKSFEDASEKTRTASVALFRTLQLALPALADAFLATATVNVHKVLSRAEKAATSTAATAAAATTASNDDQGATASTGGVRASIASRFGAPFKRPAPLKADDAAADAADFICVVATTTPATADAVPPSPAVAASGGGPKRVLKPRASLAGSQPPTVPSMAATTTATATTTAATTSFCASSTAVVAGANTGVPNNNNNSISAAVAARRAAVRKSTGGAGSVEMALFANSTPTATAAVAVAGGAVPAAAGASGSFGPQRIPKGPRQTSSSQPNLAAPTASSSFALSAVQSGSSNSSASTCALDESYLTPSLPRAKSMPSTTPTQPLSRASSVPLSAAAVVASSSAAVTPPPPSSLVRSQTLTTDEFVGALMASTTPAAPSSSSTTTTSTTTSTMGPSSSSTASVGAVARAIEIARGSNPDARAEGFTVLSALWSRHAATLQQSLDDELLTQLLSVHASNLLDSTSKACAAALPSLAAFLSLGALRTSAVTPEVAGSITAALCNLTASPLATRVELARSSLRELCAHVSLLQPALAVLEYESSQPRPRDAVLQSAIELVHSGFSGTGGAGSASTAALFRSPSSETLMMRVVSVLARLLDNKAVQAAAGAALASAYHTNPAVVKRLAARVPTDQLLDLQQYVPDIEIEQDFASASPSLAKPAVPQLEPIAGAKQPTVDHNADTDLGDLESDADVTSSWDLLREDPSAAHALTAADDDDDTGNLQALLKMPRHSLEQPTATAPEAAAPPAAAQPEPEPEATLVIEAPKEREPLDQTLLHEAALSESDLAFAEQQQQPTQPEHTTEPLDEDACSAALNCFLLPSSDFAAASQALADLARATDDSLTLAAAEHGSEALASLCATMARLYPESGNVCTNSSNSSNTVVEGAAYTRPSRILTSTST